MRFTSIILIVISFFILSSFSQDINCAPVPKTNDDSTVVNDDTQIKKETLRENWVDSVMQTLSDDEKIAQLFMVAAYSNKEADHEAEITKLIEEYKIGGLIFFQGGPVRQANLTNKYQALSKVPLLVSIDGEWGLAMRLDSTVKYPRQMTLGAIQDDQLIYQMGADIAEQCKRLGIHVNLAPVVDVNNNPKNPVINSRSFGEDKYNVARKGIAYMKGMQDNKVMANAKHFPGHGDTDTDSHKALPIIKHSPYRLNDLELYPFKELIKEGIGSMMVAHLYIPSLDSTPNQASTLSKPIVTDLLKNELKFEGLVFTDALNMKGVSSYFAPGVVDVKALLAGNDVLLFSEDVPTAIAEIKKAVANGEISQAEIDARCEKILLAKKWVGLNNYKPVELKNLYEDLNKPKYYSLNNKLYESAVTLLKNNNNLLPIKNLDTLKIATLAIGDTRVNTFQKAVSKYAKAQHFNVSKQPTEVEINKLKEALKAYNILLVSVHNTNESPGKNFGITQETINLINDLRRTNNIVLNVFANPYSLEKFYGAENVEALIMAYHDRSEAEKAVAQLIFGGIKAKGKLPVTASPLFHLDAGLETAEHFRLKEGLPEDFGINTADLLKIDQVCQKGIEDKAFPGCHVLVAKEGSIIYDKSFGYYTYEEKQPVTDSSIYDLASITKIAASTLSIMYLVDQGKLNLDYSLCDYIPELVDTTPYKNVVLRDMLAHQAGFAAWIPFYQKTLHKGEPKFEIYSKAQSDLYPHRVAEDFYINKDYPDEIIRRILETPLKNQGTYKYSDLGYYLFKVIIEKETGMSLDQFVSQTFYQPMGLASMGYKPRERFDLDQIVPTEYDLLFRKQLVRGDVHDPGAAMLGGIGGHAGVFSNAYDLAQLMQMFINDGSYGGKQYISKETLAEFTKCQYCTGESDENRRGAGFDKPVRNGDGGPTCSCVSYASFGHSGFTGTLAWADPDEDVIFIFLSNRIYPDANNRKLITEGHRTQIMEIIYDAISNSSINSLN